MPSPCGMLTREGLPCVLPKDHIPKDASFGDPRAIHVAVKDVPWSFEVPGPQPGLNHTYRIVTHPPYCPACKRGNPRLGKAESVEVWQTEVAWRASSARPSGWTPARRVIVEVDWYAPRMAIKEHEAGHDSDAPAKALLDGLAQALNVNDAVFLFRCMANEVDRQRPRTIVRVRNQ